MINKRLASLILIIAAVITFCGCSIYNKEYVVVNDFVYPQTDSNDSSDTVSVGNKTELIRAIRGMVNNGKNGGSILINNDYSGEISEDISSACWSVRTQDALGVYCVENISYELKKIISYLEADISITYSETDVPFEDIVRLQYTYGLDDVILNALKLGKTKLVVLISTSSLTEDDLYSIITEAYWKDPMICPLEPKTNVVTFSGSGSQTLYDITINYTMPKNKLDEQRNELLAVSPFSKEDVTLDDEDKVFMVADYISSECEFDEESPGTVYDALIGKKASSGGIALAFKALCNQLNLDCRIVEGQFNREERYWNIVEIDGEYYHVDMSNYMYSEKTGPLISSDAVKWGSYRWNTGDYPVCTSAKYD